MADYLVGGVGDPYADPQEALADVPSVRTEDHNILMDMAAEFVFTGDGVTHLSLSGFSGNFNITFRPKDGHSLRENIDRGSDELEYNPALGVAIRFTGAFSFLFNAVITYWRLIDLQIKGDHSAGRVLGADSGSANNFLVDRCLVDSARDGNFYVLATYGSAGIVQRTYVYLRGDSGRAIRCGGNGTIRFCAAIRNSEHAAADTAFNHLYGGKLQNSLSYGFSTPATASGWHADSWNNATEQASGLPGSDNEYSIADPFADRDKDTLDLFLVSGSDLEGEGLDDAAVTEDFFGTALEDPPNIGPDAGAPVAVEAHVTGRAILPALTARSTISVEVQTAVRAQLPTLRAHAEGTVENRASGRVALSSLRASAIISVEVPENAVSAHAVLPTLQARAEVSVPVATSARAVLSSLAAQGSASIGNAAQGRAVLSTLSAQAQASASVGVGVRVALPALRTAAVVVVESRVNARAALSTLRAVAAVEVEDGTNTALARAVLATLQGRAIVSLAVTAAGRAVLQVLAARAQVEASVAASGRAALSTLLARGAVAVQVTASARAALPGLAAGATVSTPVAASGMALLAPLRARGQAQVEVHANGRAVLPALWALALVHVEEELENNVAVRAVLPPLRARVAISIPILVFARAILAPVRGRAHVDTSGIVGEVATFEGEWCPAVVTFEGRGFE